MTAELISSESEVVEKSRFAKTDVRYWQSCLFRGSFTRGGSVFNAREWSVKIQHLSRRETFPLGTPNKAAAASRAKEIYLSLKGVGWSETLAKYKPKAESTSASIATVGEFLHEVIAKTSGNPKTLEAYCRAFRTIITDIFGFNGNKRRFDARNGGRAAWLGKVNAVKLADVTPHKVQAWKVRFLRRAGDDPRAQRAAKISVNSLLRQAKSLFAPGRLKFIEASLPEPLPFAGVLFEPRPSMRYRSAFKIEDVIASALKELPIEQLKIFLLGGLAGLRRNEIDKLEWDAFRWDECAIRVDTTHYLQPKSEDSADDVDVDPELMAMFRDYYAKAKTPFVIESNIPARLGVTYSHYRCARHFDALMAWLRAHGVTGNKPLHTLRKEFGSQVCAKYGIYAASQALRHNDIAITSQHYLERKKRISVGMGHLLVPPVLPTAGASAPPLPALPSESPDERPNRTPWPTLRNQH